MIEIKPNTFIYEFKNALKKDDCLNIIKRFEENKMTSMRVKLAKILTKT